MLILITRTRVVRQPITEQTQLNQNKVLISESLKYLLQTKVPQKRLTNESRLSILQVNLLNSSTFNEKKQLTSPKLGMKIPHRKKYKRVLQTKGFEVAFETQVKLSEIYVHFEIGCYCKTFQGQISEVLSLWLCSSSELFNLKADITIATPTTQQIRKL